MKIDWNIKDRETKIVYVCFVGRGYLDDIECKGAEVTE